MALGNPPFRSMIFPARKTSRSVTFGDFPASHLADFPRLIPKITWLKIIHPYTSKTYDIPKYELLIIPRISPSAQHWYWWFQSLWKIWKSVGVIIPNIWNVINFMFQTFQTTNQKKMVTIPNPRFPLAPPQKNGPWASLGAQLRHLASATSLSNSQEWSCRRWDIPWVQQ